MALGTTQQSEENSSAVEEVSASAAALKRLAQDLQWTVAQFKLSLDDMDTFERACGNGSEWEGNYISAELCLGGITARKSRANRSA